MKDKHPTPQEVRQARKAAGLLQREAAASIGVSMSAWQRYETGGNKMPLPYYEFFKMKHKL